LRRDLISQYGAGKINADQMLAEAAKAKLKVLRGSESGARRKSLFDGAKAVGTLLAQAVNRVKQDRALMPASSRSDASKLARQAEKLKVEIAALYTDAVE